MSEPKHYGMELAPGEYKLAFGNVPKPAEKPKHYGMELAPGEYKLTFGPMSKPKEPDAGT